MFMYVYAVLSAVQYTVVSEISASSVNVYMELALLRNIEHLIAWGMIICIRIGQLNAVTNLLF